MEREDTIDHIREWLLESVYPGFQSDRERQILCKAREMARCMRNEGRFFNVTDSAAALKIPDEDLPAVRERVYDLALRRVLRGFAITEKDRSGLRWIGKVLRMPEETCRTVEFRAGRQVFDQHFAFSISAGVLDDEERAQLTTLSLSLGFTIRDMLLQYLTERGSEFLSQIFTGLEQDGRIPEEAWQRLLDTIQSLGVTAGEFIAVLKPHMKDFLERTLKMAGTPDKSGKNLPPALQSLVIRISGGAPAQKSGPP